MNSITLHFPITSLAIKINLFQNSVCSYHSTNILTKASSHQPSLRLHLLLCFSFLFLLSASMTFPDMNPASSLVGTASASCISSNICTLKLLSYTILTSLLTQLIPPLTRNKIILLAIAKGIPFLKHQSTQNSSCQPLTLLSKLLWLWCHSPTF